MAENLGDVLSIIIQAQLDPKDEQALHDRLQSIKEEYENFQIKIQLDDEKLGVLKELSENIEALNNRIVESEKRKQEAIKASVDIQTEDQRRIKGALEEQRREYEKLKVTIEDANRVTERFSADMATSLAKSITTGSSFVTQTETQKEGETKSYEVTVNTQKFNEAMESITNKISQLERRGLNLSNISEELQSLSIDTVQLDEKIASISRRIKELNDTSKFLDRAGTRIDKMSQPYKDVEIEQLTSQEGITKRIAEINKIINDHKQKGEILTEGHKKSLDNELNVLQQQINAYQSISKEYERFSNQLGRLGKAFEPEEDVRLFKSQEQILSRIERIQRVINGRREQGVGISTENKERLEDQLETLNKQIGAYKKMQAEIEHLHKEGLKENLRRDSLGTKVGQIDPDSFDDKKFENTQRRLEEEARKYFENSHGIEAVNNATIKLSRSKKDLNNEVWKATTTIDEGNNVLKTYTLNIDRATNSMYSFGESVNRSRSIGHASLFEQIERSMRRVPAYLATFGLAYKMWGQVTQGFQDLYEIDTAMTQLIKVTQATETQFKDFRMEAARMGQELGVTTAEVINSVTEFSRLGYTLQESAGLGEQSIIFANVGNMNVDAATTNLLSAIRGFNVSASDAVSESSRFVDIFNEVGNNFAISQQGIGEALKRSSAVLNVAGNSVEESVALVTAANATIQDPKKVGTAMKTIAMRLRGIDEEGGKIAGLVPQLKQMFEDVGIDLMLDPDTFKSTFQIFEELSSVWDSLTDVRQANILEAIGGKRQGSIVAAMIGNWQDARDAFETGVNSAGSAAAEYAKYQESMEYRVGQLKNSMEEFWLTVWDTDAIKAAIDGLNLLVRGLIKLVDTFGAVAPAAGLAFASFTFLNQNNRTAFLDKLNQKMLENNQRVSDSLQQVTMEMGRVSTRGQRYTNTLQQVTMEMGRVSTRGQRVGESLQQINMEMGRVSTRGQRFRDSLQQVTMEMGRVSTRGQSVNRETSNMLNPETPSQYAQNLEGVSYGLDRARTAGTRLVTGMMMFAKPLLIIMAISYGIEAIVKAMNKASKARENNIKRLEEEVQSSKAYFDSFSDFDLVNYYSLQVDVNSGEIKKQSVEYEKFKMLQEELIQNFPDLIDYYNDEGEAVLKSAHAIERHNEEKREQMILDAKTLAEEKHTENIQTPTTPFEMARHFVGMPEGEYDKLDLLIDKLHEAQREFTMVNQDEEGIKLVEKFISQEDINDFDVWSKEYRDRLTNFQEEINNLVKSDELSEGFMTRNQALFDSLGQGNMEASNRFVKNYLAQMDGTREAIQKRIKEIEADIAEGSKGFHEQIDMLEDIFLLENNIKSSSNEGMFAKRVSEIMKDGKEVLGYGTQELVEIFPETINKINDILKDEDIDFADLVKEGGTEEVKKQLDDILETLDKTEDVYHILLKFRQELDRQSAGKETEEVSFDTSQIKNDINKNIGEHVDELARLQSVYDDLNDGKTLSLKQISELTRDYPKLSKALEKRAGLLTLNKNEVQKLMKAEKEQHIKFIENMQEQINEKKRKVTESIKESLRELRAHDKFLQLLQKGETAKLRVELESEIKKNMMPKDIFELPKLGNEDTLFERARLARIKHLQDLLADLDKYEGLGEELKELELLLHTDFSGANNRISGEAYEELVYVTSLFRDRLREINVELREQTLIKSRHSRGSEAYREALRAEIKLLEEQMELNRKIKKDLQEQIDSGYVYPTDTSLPASQVRASNNQVSGGGGTYTFQSAPHYVNKDLREQTPITAEHFDKILEARAKNPAIKGTGKHFIEAANKTGLDALYLFAHAMSETGWGSSNIVKNKNNFYGIGAVDNAPYEEAYSYSDVRQGILDGADWIAEKYVNGQYGQNTLQKMRFNDGVHQYATDPNWAKTISEIMANTTKNVLGNTITSATKVTESAIQVNGEFQNAAKYYLDNYRVTDTFGSRGGAHKGVDFGRKSVSDPSIEGAPLKAVTSGTVARIQYQATGGGHLVVVTGDDGSETKYMHMMEKPNLSVGQRVDAGQLIGKIGDTGVSSGPHIHLERWENNGGTLKAVDPLAWINQLAGGSVATTGGGAGFTASSVLKQGASNSSELVKALQTALNKNGANLKVDGVFGTGTKRAVANFQSGRSGLKVDGVAGKSTLAALGLLDIGGASLGLDPAYSWLLPKNPKVTAPQVGSNWQDWNRSHTVRQGETLTSIANQYGTTATSVAAMNNRSVVQMAKAGEVLRVPSVNTTNQSQAATPTSGGINSDGTYTVKKGDTLSGIGQKLGISWKNLANWNNISAPYTIRVGQKLRTTATGGGGGGTTTTTTTTTPASNNGLPAGVTQDQADESVERGEDYAAQLDTEYMEAQERVARLYLEGIESVALGYDQEAAKVNPNIALLEFLGEQVLDTTPQYRYFQNRIGELLADQRKLNRDSIDYLQDQIRNDPNLDDSQREDLQKIVDERKIREIDFDKRIRETDKRGVESLYNETLKNIDDKWREWEGRLDDISRNIRMLDTNEDRTGHIALLNQQTEAQQRQRAQALQNILVLKEEQENLKNYPDLLQKNQEEIDEWRKKLKELDLSIFETDRQIVQVYENMAEEVINTYKEMLTKMRDLELKAIDDRLKAQEKAHKETMQRYDDEQEAFNENINEQLKALDRSERERDYNRELEKMQEDRQKIADELALYALDDSLSGRARAKELTEQLEEKDEEIYEYERDRRNELHREALNDALEARGKELDELREIENENMEKAREDADKEREDVNKDTDNKLEDHDLFKQIHEQLIEGNVEGMLQSLQQYIDLISSNPDFFGENASQKMIEDINKTMSDLLGFDYISDQISLDIKSILQANSDGYTLTNKDILDITTGLTGFDKDEFLNNIGSNPASIDSIRRYFENINEENFPSRPSMPTLQEDGMVHFMPYSEPQVEGQTLTVTMNIANVEGGSEGAKLLLEELTSELAKKGVTF